MLQPSNVLDISAPVLTVHSEDRFRIESLCRIGAEEHTLYFEVTGVPPFSRAEPFLCMLLASAQKLGLDIVVHAPISPVLLSNLAKLQAQFAEWWPDEFRIVQIHTDGQKPMEPATDVHRGGACCFSMGVDAFHTALKYSDEIDYLVYAHGFDTEVDARDLMVRVSSHLHLAARELGKRPFEIETNGRLITDPLVWWGYQGGGFLGSVAMLISPVVNRLVIAQHWSEEQDHPWAIHPKIDPYWSTDTIQVESDAMVARVDKVRDLVKSSTALKYLRVCWDGRCIGYNCGRCPKCVRTLISLRVFRAKAPRENFVQPLNLMWVAFSSVLTDEEKMWYREMLEAMDKLPYRDIPLRWAMNAAIDGRYHTGSWHRWHQAFRRIKWCIRNFGRPGRVA